MGEGGGGGTKSLISWAERHDELHDVFEDTTYSSLSSDKLHNAVLVPPYAC